jgi:hypothetical protein
MTTSTTRPSGSSWLLLAAWLAVGVPLLWGVAQTVHKALALFG